MRPKNAFTLVELLVVIGIIAILIAMLLPALNKARQSAQQTQCLSNERQIAMAMLSYANDYGGRLPAVYVGDGGKPDYWFDMLMPYLGFPNYFGANKIVDARMFTCPSETTDANATYIPMTPNLQRLDFGVNYYSYYNAVANIPEYGQFGIQPPGSCKTSQVKNPSMVFMLMDSRHMPYGNGSNYATYAIYSPFKRGLVSTGWPLDTDTDGDGMKDTFSVFAGIGLYYNGANFRHGSGRYLNVMFMDGHGASVGKKEWTKAEHWSW